MDSPPSITISMQELEIVHEFVYLGSMISGKAATMFSRLTKRVWLTKKLTTYTKIQIYKACVLNTLLYCSESWTLCARQERKLNTFHMHCLQHLFGITWQDKVPNRVVLERAGIFIMYTLLKQ